MSFLDTVTPGTTFAGDVSSRSCHVERDRSMGRRFTYDANGRILTQTLPDQRVVGFSYDANGNLTSVTPPSRPAHTFTYTPLDFAERYTPPAVAARA